MVYIWYKMPIEDHFKMIGKVVWKYLPCDSFIKPQKGVIRFIDGEMKFCKLGEKEGKGRRFSYASNFADTEAEAVADYNEKIEKIAKRYDEAIERLEKSKLPVKGHVHDPLIYTYEDAQAGILNGRTLYYFRNNHARSKPVKVKVTSETIEGNYGEFTLVYMDRIREYGDALGRRSFGQSNDYFAETEEGAGLKYNELIDVDINKYRETTELIRREKVSE